MQVETIRPQAADELPKIARVTDRNPDTIFTSLQLAKNFIRPGDVLVSSGSGLLLLFEQWAYSQGAKIVLIDQSLHLSSKTHAVRTYTSASHNLSATFIAKELTIPSEYLSDSEFDQLQKQRLEIAQAIAIIICSQPVPSSQLMDALPRVHWFLDSYGPIMYLRTEDEMVMFLSHIHGSLDEERGMARLLPVSNRPEFFDQCIARLPSIRIENFTSPLHPYEGGIAFKRS